MILPLNLQHLSYGALIGMLLVGLSPCACKTRSKGSSGLEAFGENYVETFFVNDEIARGPSECRSQLVNMASTSLADGLLLNGAITGLGTGVLTGKKLKTESTYFQALRVYSIFDWEMHQRLTKPGQAICLPRSLHASFGPLAKGTAENLPKAFPDFVSKARKSIQALTNEGPSFDVTEVDAYQPPQLWPRLPGGSETHRKALEEGYLAKLRHIASFTTKGTELKPKLKAMGLTLTPLGAAFDATFPPSDLGKGQTFLEAYLPPLYTLTTPDIEDAETWYLERGIARRQLPQPYDIGIARLTHIAYLDKAPDNILPAIKVQLYKDYGNPDAVRTHVVFGKVAPDGSEKGILPLDFRSPETALVLSFYPNLAPRANDSATYRYLKKEINSLINPLRVEARVHQLAVDFVRQPHGDPIGKSPDSVLLKPRFSLRGSDISFRIFIDTEKGTSAKALQALGFSCSKNAGRDSCYRDFGGYRDVGAFFEEGPQGILANLNNSVSRRFEHVVNLLLKYNAKILINWQMDAIEEAIDQQFFAIFREVVESQITTKSRIQNRIERLMFKD